MNLLLLAAAVAIMPAAVAWSSHPRIEVYHPIEGDHLPSVAGTYILGNIQPLDAKLTINGRPVRVHAEGGFLAFLPVRPGPFVFHCEVRNSNGTTVLKRNIFVESPLLPPTTDVLTVDRRSLEPQEDLELRPGDWVRVQARAPRGMKGSFRIDGVQKDLSLTETRPGLYEGAYQIREGDGAEQTKIRLYLKGRLGKLEVDLPGRLTILQDPFRTVVFQGVPYPFSNGSGTRNHGTILFTPNGVKSIMTGRIGEKARIQLSPSETGWVPLVNLRDLPLGTPLPQAVLGTIEIQKRERSSIIKLSWTEPVPHRVVQKPGLLRLLLYHTDAHTNWIQYEAEDPHIQEIRWQQTPDGTTRVDMWLNGRTVLWGYNTEVTPDRLQLELRWPPPSIAGKTSSLSGTTIVLDPGHSPSDNGRVGPLGVPERAHNLNTAKILETMLRKEDAKVVLTRDGDEEVSLQERVDLAWQVRADALISLHNNALPAGVNPFASHHGFSVYYYHPHSRPLAASIYQAYQKYVPLADEGLHFGDLFIPRTPRMPSVLVESAYFIYPEQEQKLLSRKFQIKLAQALLKGLKDFFEKSRGRRKRKLRAE